MFEEEFSEAVGWGIIRSWRTGNSGCGEFQVDFRVWRIGIFVCWRVGNFHELECMKFSGP
jgi:hypothetical protein